MSLPRSEPLFGDTMQRSPMDWDNTVCFLQDRTISWNMQSFDEPGVQADQVAKDVYNDPPSSSQNKEHGTASIIDARRVDSPLDNAFVSLCDLNLPEFPAEASPQTSSGSVDIDGSNASEVAIVQATLTDSVGVPGSSMLERFNAESSLLRWAAEEERGETLPRRRDDETEPTAVSLSQTRSANDPAMDEANASRSDVSRARNRMAAAKCRQKQKLHRGALQKDAEQLCARNKRLKQQERLLRNALTFLRDCALQHDSTRCDCDSLHTFNAQRAEDFYTHISRRRSDIARRRQSILENRDPGVIG